MKRYKILSSTLVYVSVAHAIHTTTAAPAFEALLVSLLTQRNVENILTHAGTQHSDRQVYTEGKNRF